jgi:VWFA-related protein
MITFARRRLGAALAAVLCAGVLLTAQSDVSLRIASPTADAYVTGPVRLVAVVEPGPASRLVAQVTFFVDGKQVCAVARPPFECDWEAGDRIRSHVVRVVATLGDGRRLVQSVTTKDVEYAEAVDVDVVQVTAVVTDEHGNFVRGLKRDDFRVVEDGKPQALTHFAAENVPLELVMAVDVSSSMKDALPTVKDAAKRFLAGVEARDQVTLLGFNDNIFTLARRSTNRAARERAVDRMSAWGGTALHDVIIQAIDILGRQSGRRSILLFSDGDDQSSHATLDAALAKVDGSDATIYTVGHGRATQERKLQNLLERLAHTSGGRAFVASDASKSDEVFAQILDDLRHQYLLAYPTPSSARDGAWHKIQVEVPGTKHRVRARQGYRLVRR